MRQVLVIGGGLIVLYLLVAHATGAGQLIGATGTATSGVVKTFQGR